MAYNILSLKRRFVSGKAEWILVALICIGILTSVEVIWRRVKFEHHNRTVDMVLSYTEVQRLAALSGVSTDKMLSILASKTDVTGIAIEEDTPESLMDAGKISLFPESDLRAMQRLGAAGTLLNSIAPSANRANFQVMLMDDPATTSRIREALRKELGDQRVIEPGPTTLAILDDLDDLKTIGLGFSPNEWTQVQAFGFQVVPRLRNSFRLNDDLIRYKLNEASDIAGANTIIFDGDTALGYPNLTNEVAKRLQTSVFNIGLIEFFDQAGARELSYKVPDRVLRVHSVPAPEMKETPVPKVIRRYVRAANERGVLILFLHPIFDQPTNAGYLADNIAFFNTISKLLKRDHFQIATVKQTSVLEFKAVSKIETGLITISILAGTLLLVRRFVKMTKRHWIFAGAVCVALLQTVLFSKLSAHGLQLMGVLACVVFPTYALIAGFPSQVSGATFFRRQLNAITFLVQSVGISAIGALFLAGLFSSPRFILGIQIFSGVKIAFILPLILIGLYFYLRPNRLSSIWFVFKRLFLSPVKSGALIAAVFCALFVFLLLLRSGNYISFRVPGFESGMREWLENALSIRPRTKEFLIGYPILLFAYLQVDRRISRQWIWIFLCIGSVGLISLVNSFCHFHTPLNVTVYRSIIGLALGIVLGIIYYWAVELIFKLKGALGQTR